MVMSVTAVESRKRRPMRSNDGKVGGRCFRTSRYGSRPVSELLVSSDVTSVWPSAVLVARMGGRSTEVNTGGDVSFGIIGSTV